MIVKKETFISACNALDRFIAQHPTSKEVLASCIDLIELMGEDTSGAVRHYFNNRQLFFQKDYTTHDLRTPESLYGYLEKGAKHHASNKPQL